MSAAPLPLGQVPAQWCVSTPARISRGGPGLGGWSLPEDGGPGRWSPCAPARAMGRGALVQSPWATDPLTEGRPVLLLNQAPLSSEHCPSLLWGGKYLESVAPALGGLAGLSPAGHSQGGPK